MIELGVIRDLVAIFGVIAGFTYYVMTVRNTRQNRMKEIIFQRMQTRADLEYQKMIREIDQMRYGWNTIEEYHMKYNMETTPDLVLKRGSVIARLESWGFLLREGLLDEKYIDRLYRPFMIIRLWESYEKLYLHQRESQEDPEAFKDLEYLYNVVKKRHPNISADTKFSWDKARDRILEQRHNVTNEKQ